MYPGIADTASSKLWSLDVCLVSFFQVCLAAAKNYNSGHATVITTCKSGKAERTFFYKGGREVVINKKSIRGNIGV